jgi:hypothetical protein
MPGGTSQQAAFPGTVNHKTEPDTSNSQFQKSIFQNLETLQIVQFGGFYLQ